MENVACVCMRHPCTVNRNRKVLEVSLLLVGKEKKIECKTKFNIYPSFRLDYQPHMERLCPHEINHLYSISEHWTLNVRAKTALTFPYFYISCSTGLGSVLQ